MNEHLEQYLKDKYPEIIPDKFHFECSDGWFLILNGAFQEMMSIKTMPRFKDVPYPQVMQIKEKFGSMRFYIAPLEGGQEYYDRIYTVVTMAEGLSFCTCESCGRPGFPRDQRWVKVYCPWCATDSRKTFNNEWVNACLEMIQDEKDYNNKYKDWDNDALDKLSDLDQELGLE